jgi:hypothetical protein
VKLAWRRYRSEKVRQQQINRTVARIKKRRTKAAREKDGVKKEKERSKKLTYLTLMDKETFTDFSSVNLSLRTH